MRPPVAGGRVEPMGNEYFQETETVSSAYNAQRTGVCDLC